jgi:hypothetical protein
MVCFAPIACRVLGMTSGGDHATFWSTDQNMKSGLVAYCDSVKMICFGFS